MGRCIAILAGFCIVGDLVGLAADAAPRGHAATKSACAGLEEVVAISADIADFRACICLAGGANLPFLPIFARRLLAIEIAPGWRCAPRSPPARARRMLPFLPILPFFVFSAGGWRRIGVD